MTTWSARTGNPLPAVSTAAKVPTSAEPASTQGLQVSVPTTGNGARVAYVTDTTPAAETTYHARFAFNANTLRSGGAAAVTVFEGRTGNGNQAFTVQYRWTTATGPQLRATLLRTGGTTTGPWVTLTGAAQLVQVDWLSATAGSLRLTINGVAQPLFTGNTSARLLESVRLGITAGPTNGTGSSGTAYVDSFLSTRTTMP